MDENIKGKIYNILKSAKKQSDTDKVTHQEIILGNKFEAGNDINITVTTKKTYKRQYSPGSIGYNGLLVTNIKKWCKKIIEARTKLGNRDGQTVAKVFYRTFCKNFNVNSMVGIYDLPESIASDVINYLEQTYNNTKEGRIRNAAKKTGYTHSVGHYFRIEKEILEKLNKKSDDPDLVDLRLRLFNAHSRKDLNQMTWKLYIEQLEEMLDRLLSE